MDETTDDREPAVPARVPEWGHEGTSQEYRIEFWSAGCVLRTARAYAGFSQRELAERTGVSLSTITRAEAGRADPSWFLVARCLEACRVRVALIGEGDEADELVTAMPLVARPDRGGRRYPAHLPVWKVERAEQWWDGTLSRRVPFVPLELIPPFSFRRRHPKDQGKARWERG